MKESLQGLSNEQNKFLLHGNHGNSVSKAAQNFVTFRTVMNACHAKYDIHFEKWNLFTVSLNGCRAFQRKNFPRKTRFPRKVISAKVFSFPRKLI